MGKKYKLLGFNSQDNTANVLILSTGKVLKVNIKELEKSEIADDLDNHEIKSLYRKLYSSFPHTPSVYEIEERNEKSWVVYSLLALLLTIFYTFSNIAAAKPVYIEYLDIIVTPGTFIYPFSFLVIDLLSEFYGFKLARKAIFMSLFSNLVIVSLLSLSTSLPAIPGWELNEQYNTLVNHILSAILASSLSFLVSELVNSYILCKLKDMTHSRFLALRVFFSTFVASIIDSFVFCFIAFYGKLPLNQIIVMMMVQMLIKIFFALFNVFPAYGSRYLFNRWVIKAVN
ncbi:VUT family protein [Xenorhabdus sp. 12]|uniref:Probable queuosine precursor transporter n=1 Tax=Xenorhabdus santafensis TaxID=2582833 RepID=A0ABU4S5H9_9GAMM|nr:queuosine precursor transporter [Xenorhabdus sp. 12]MDX7985874.1 VUT family protein [Xenorhabdus sp. 12]